MIHYFGQSATIKLTHIFMVVGWWVTVDFDSQYKIVWGETRAHGGTNSCKKTEFKKRICRIILTSYNIRLTHVGEGGILKTAEVCKSGQFLID